MQVEDPGYDWFSPNHCISLGGGVRVINETRREGVKKPLDHVIARQDAGLKCHLPAVYAHRKGAAKSTHKGCRS